MNAATLIFKRAVLSFFLDKHPQTCQVFFLELYFASTSFTSIFFATLVFLYLRLISPYKSSVAATGLIIQFPQAFLRYFAISNHICNEIQNPIPPRTTSNSQVPSGRPVGVPDGPAHRGPPAVRVPARAAQGRRLGHPGARPAVPLRRAAGRPLRLAGGPPILEPPNLQMLQIHNPPNITHPTKHTISSLGSLKFI